MAEVILKEIGSDKEKVAEKYSEITGTGMEEARKAVESVAQGNVIVLTIPDPKNVSFVIQQFSDAGAVVSENKESMEKDFIKKEKQYETSKQNIEIEDKEEPKQVLEFYKGTMLGNIVYKAVNTTIEVFDTALRITKDTKKIFRRNNSEERSFQIANILSASIRVAWDFWDTLYAIIFVLLGLVEPVLFIMALVCLWCGYGKIIEITMINDEKYSVPFKLSKQEAEILLNICNAKG